MEWLIKYGFEKLNLHKINLGVIKENVPTVNLYKSLNFIIEGEMRDEIFRKGKFYNVLTMAIFYRSKK